MGCCLSSLIIGINDDDFLRLKCAIFALAFPVSCTTALVISVNGVILTTQRDGCEENQGIKNKGLDLASSLSLALVVQRPLSQGTGLRSGTWWQQPWIEGKGLVSEEGSIGGAWWGMPSLEGLWSPSRPPTALGYPLHQSWTISLVLHLGHLFVHPRCSFLGLQEQCHAPLLQGVQLVRDLFKHCYKLLLKFNLIFTSLHIRAKIGKFRGKPMGMVVIGKKLAVWAGKLVICDWAFWNTILISSSWSETNQVDQNISGKVEIRVPLSHETIGIGPEGM